VRELIFTSGLISTLSTDMSIQLVGNEILHMTKNSLGNYAKGNHKIKRSWMIQVRELHSSLEPHSPLKELLEQSSGTVVLLDTDAEPSFWLAICGKPCVTHLSDVLKLQS